MSNIPKNHDNFGFGVKAVEPTSAGRDAWQVSLGKYVHEAEGWVSPVSHAEWQYHHSVRYGGSSWASVGSVYTHYTLERFELITEDGAFSVHFVDDDWLRWIRTNFHNAFGLDEDWFFDDWF